MSATGCPGLASATQIVKDVYISSEPFGLDLGEQAVCWSESGESTLLSGRVLQTIEVRDVSAAPEGVFDWTTPAPSSTPQLAPLLPYPLSPES